ncbi:hypothetical protein H2199_001719 [Coniosporium tulheliwenetii]|uniref:Uncharacterized protein n=1 Tax=Coniosporium tulheliwenetii TaxID=3383036 RepID=A0ACC2ZK52_9PEZI|nr:hypothetical protein H2199_001719 [Cladosporium sp. JES 115]
MEQTIVEASIDSTGPKSITSLLTADKHTYSTIKNYERSIIRTAAARNQPKAIADFPGIAPDASGPSLKWLNTITARYQLVERLIQELLAVSSGVDPASPAFPANTRKFKECGLLLLYRLRDLEKSRGGKSAFIDQLPSSSLAAMIHVLFEARGARSVIIYQLGKMPEVLVDIIDDRATQR